MPEVILSDYFYGDESEEFVFFKIPRQLITNPKFKHVSTDAKLLYGMLLDRMSLSARNGWYDDTGRVYIYYSVDEICGDMTCGRDKAMKLLAELDTRKGVGLIERIKQGQGKPTKIYVKRFTTRTIPANPAPPPLEPFAPISEVGKIDFQKSKKPTLIILKETRQSLSSLIHPSPPESPRRRDWRWIDTSEGMPLATLTKKARKITAAQHRATDTICSRRATRRMRHDTFPLRGKAERHPSRRKARAAPCGRRHADRTLRLPYSHSPSVESVAGNG